MLIVMTPDVLVRRPAEDVMVGEIGEGTSEIQRTVIARLLGA